jgi:predicted small metal-binding protein
MMFEYVCDRVIPGCTSKERGDTKDAAREAARLHLAQHHGMDHMDAQVWSKVDVAIMLRQ